MSEIVASQSNREDNLNVRGTAVAGAAGLIVALASGVAKTIFRELDDPWVDIAGGLFIVALGAVAASILLVVLGVLKPRTRFLSDPEESSRKHLALALLREEIDLTDAEHVEASYVKHARSAVDSWLRRNLEKQMYLRASYICLALGTVLFGVTAIVIAMAPVRAKSGAKAGNAGGEIGWVPVLIALAVLAIAACVGYHKLIREVGDQLTDLDKELPARDKGTEAIAGPS